MKTHPTYKGRVVRVIPWWIKLAIYTINAQGVAFLGRIYLRKDLYSAYKAGNADTRVLAVLAHEVRHVERANEVGKIFFIFKMFFFRSYKFQEEVEADRAAMDVYATQREEFPIERRARFLSSWRYFWCVSYEHAKEVLTQEWKKAKQKSLSQ